MFYKLVMRKSLNLLLVFIFISGQFAWSAPSGDLGITVKKVLPVLTGMECIPNGHFNFFWDNGNVKSDGTGLKPSLSLFFTAVAVPDKDWWVNLSVLDTEDTVLGKGLSGTDLGRIFLSADLELKKSVSHLLSDVNSPFWERVRTVLNRYGLDMFCTT